MFALIFISLYETKTKETLHAAFFDPDKIIYKLLMAKEEVEGKSIKIDESVRKSLEEFSDRWLTQNLMNICPKPCLLIKNKEQFIGNIPDITNMMVRDFKEQQKLIRAFVATKKPKTEQTITLEKNDDQN